MPNHRKHFTRWFTTSGMRSINLDWVTDIRIHKTAGRITGASVYQGVNEGEGQASLFIDAKDAAKLLDLLW
jgi:hypothetical protein